MRLLVTGGAGYVGSVCAAHLLDAGHEVVVLDDLSTGHADAVPDGARFVEGDLGEAADEVLAEGFDGVLHFAAPLAGRRVGRAARAVLARQRRDDAAAAGGDARATARRGWCSPPPPPPTASRSRCRSARTRPTRPTNPYGATKLAIDHAITSYAAAHGLAAVSLRYFNVAGAYGRFGERHSSKPT